MHTSIENQDIHLGRPFALIEGSNVDPVLLRHSYVIESDDALS